MSTRCSCAIFSRRKASGFEAIDQIIISSVVPDLTRTLVRMCEVYFGIAPLLVEAGVKTGLKIRYENPKELGADRIVNAVSGIERYGAPLIIVDFGTATTFCAINADKEYLGGAITAGIGISMESLFSHAAKLPKVELVAPDQVIGRTTVDAMSSGLVFGYADLVDGMIARIAREMGSTPEDIFVVATRRPQRNDLRQLPLRQHHRPHAHPRRPAPDRAAKQRRPPSCLTSVCSAAAA